jgi:acyl-CoA synthetase (AMP-forming)/AMP-acid ligase II
VYNLLPSFLDPNVTEEEICRVYELPREQVAAARAYVLSNPDTVLAEHLKIEERMAIGNPPEVQQQAVRAMATFKNFKQWLAEKQAAGSEENGAQNSRRLPTFREWLAEQTTD